MLIAYFVTTCSKKIKRSMYEKAREEDKAMWEERFTYKEGTSLPSPCLRSDDWAAMEIN